jgi:hypothetical protein
MFFDPLDFFFLGIRLSANLWSLDFKPKEQPFNATDQVGDASALKDAAMYLDPPASDLFLKFLADRALQPAFCLLRHAVSCPIIPKRREALHSSAPITDLA